MGTAVAASGSWLGMEERDPKLFLFRPSLTDRTLYCRDRKEIMLLLNTSHVYPTITTSCYVLTLFFISIPQIDSAREKPDRATARDELCCLSREDFQKGGKITVVVSIILLACV